MKILLINNGTKHLKELKKLLIDHTLQVIGSDQVVFINPMKYDAIILSGSSLHSVTNNVALYKHQIELVKQTKKPILGICLGYELIVFAYGGKLVRLDQKIETIKQIKIIQSDPLFSNVNDISVYEAHGWGVKKMPESFFGLAQSNDGYEIIKHKYRLIYGFQFHPEAFTDTTNGYLLLKNFLEISKSNGIL